VIARKSSAIIFSKDRPADLLVMNEREKRGALS
jgi:hypothetical protein